MHQVLVVFLFCSVYYHCVQTSFCSVKLYLCFLLLLIFLFLSSSVTFCCTVNKSTDTRVIGLDNLIYFLFYSVQRSVSVLVFIVIILKLMSSVLAELSHNVFSSGP